MRRKNFFSRMDNGSGSDKKKNKTQQLTPSTERKTSGCNWETYKNLSPKPKTEESTGERSVSQNRHPKLRKVHTTPLRTEPREESSKHNATIKNKENKTLTKQREESSKHNATIKNKENKTLTKQREEISKQNATIKNKENKTLTKQWEESSKHNATIKNKENKSLTKQVAMDCEMVGIGDGTESMIARVSIVNKYGNCVYDKYVKPREKVVDYRTAISGVRPEHLQNGENFNIVQKEVADILKSRILVGHALKHDLNVLYLSHPRRYWRDTSRYKPFRQISKGNTPSLKKLAHELLGREIQVGEHSSVEDAKAAMQLYMLYKNQWESGRKY